MFNSKKEPVKPTAETGATTTPSTSASTPSKTYSSPSRTPDTTLNVIGRETEIEGNIKCRGNIRIDGHLKGTITSEGKLVVSETGSVEGDVFCRDAQFAGNITGNIKARGKVTIKPKAFIKGDVRYHDLEIEPGAHIACTISRMNPDKKEEALPSPSASVKKTVTPEKEIIPSSNGVAK